LADIKKVYWDTCVWLALINEEADKLERCQNVLALARARSVEIWTSAFTLGEVFKKNCEGKGVALPENKDVEFERFVEQDFFVLVQVDYDIGVTARRLLRSHPPLKKPADGIHLATAVLNNLDEFHTFDEDNLIPLHGQVNRADGVGLVICLPPLPVQPALTDYSKEPSERERT
jgi:predicted nucleic acid-binding protein